MDSESPEPIVSLNVGGKKFTTSRETLCKVSNSLSVSVSCGIPTRLCLRVQLAASAQQLCCLPPEKLSIAHRSVTTSKLCRVECLCDDKFERVLSTSANTPCLVAVQDATSMLSRMFSGRMSSRRDEKVREARKSHFTSGCLWKFLSACPYCP